MARKLDKRLISKKKSNLNSGDVTINDFANSPLGLHGRLTKAIANNNVESMNIEEQMKRQSRSRRRNKRVEIIEDSNGIDYPLDLWFLISEYIAPETIGKFARICKSSHHVVQTAKFWFHLYKRFYKNIANLPERLKPECMVRPYGLRACVIRTLYFTYFSSVNGIGHNCTSSQEDPHSLVGTRCSLMWHKKGENRWYFYFKLKEITKFRHVLKEEITWDNEQNADLTEMLEDVSANSEEGCRVLRIVCLRYGMIPLVTGLILQTVKLDLSPGFEHHRLQLSFGTNYIPKTPTQIIVLSGVVDCKVLNWWHPGYPHQDTDSTLLRSTAETWDTPNSFDSPLRTCNSVSSQAN